MLATKGYIKYFRNAADYGLASVHRSKHGYLCVEAMVLRIGDQSDPETGKALTSILPVLPTHYKCPQTGALLPVENPHTWIYHEELKG